MKLNTKKASDIVFSKIIAALGFLWLIIPFIIFCFGWLKIQIAIPVTIAVLIAAFLAVRSSPVWQVPEFTQKGILIAVLSVIFIGLWVTASGIGGVMYQNDDFYYRNAILKDLINNPWPVIFGNTGIEGHDTLALVYYFAFFLPSALVGKILGFKCALIMLWLWSFAGIFLVWIFLTIRSKRISIYPVLFLMLFSGLDIIGAFFCAKPVSITEHLEWWVVPWQYSSMSTQLFWVFNQAIPTWLIMSFLVLQKNRKSVVLLLGMLLLYAPFPFVGALPFFLWFIFKAGCESTSVKNFSAWIKELCTFENVVGGGLTGIISFLFLSCNISGQKMRFYPFQNNDIWRYILFVLLEFGILSLILYYREKRNPFYYISIGSLLIFPLIQVGAKYDFCMRASIPALFMLMLFAINAIMEEKKKIIIFFLVIVLGIGSFTSLAEINRSVIFTARGEEKGKYSYSTVLQSHPELKPNFLGENTGNIFFDFLAKNK